MFHESQNKGRTTNELVLYPLNPEIIGGDGSYVTQFIDIPYIGNNFVINIFTTFSCIIRSFVT